VSVLSSDGEVKIYDIATLEKSDKDVTTQKIRKCSRDTISYHKEFKYVLQSDFDNEIKNFGAFIPEEGLLSNDSIRMRDVPSLDLNSTIKKPYASESRCLSAFKPHLEPPYRMQCNVGSLLSSSRLDCEESKINDGERAVNINE
jgi:hypothetical protein